MEILSIILSIIGGIILLLIFGGFILFMLRENPSQFIKMSLIWIGFFAVLGVLIVLLGDSLLYIGGIAGFAILIYIIFFSSGSGGGDDNFPEPGGSDF